MVVAFALWSMAVEANEPVEFAPPADLHITNVALGADLEDESGRTTLKLIYSGLPATPESDEEDEEDEEQAPEPIATVLCSLTPGKVEQAKIDLILERSQTYVFDMVGKNTLYISGNYIEQNPSDLPPDEDEILDDEEEEVFRLEDVSSDVEVEADEMEEEEAPELLLPPSPPKAKVQKADSKKRPLEDDDEPAAEQQLSKKQRKKMNKQLKAEAGNAAPEPTQEKKTEPKKQEQKPVHQKKAGEGDQQGEGKKKRKKNKGDKAKL